MTFDRSSRIILIRGFLLLGAFLVLACDDDTTGPESTPPVLTISPSQQWAGGEARIQIVGERFLDEDVVVAGDDTLEIFDRQNFVLGVRLPTDVNGPTTLDVIREGKALGSVTVEAYGFEETRIYPVPINDMMTEFPVEWGVAVVGQSDDAGETSAGFSWIHPSIGISRHFPGTSDPDLGRLFRVGVDPVSGILYHEWNWAYEVHAGQIIGGELVDLGWVNRPCQRWGCEPLAGDIWVVHEWLVTCRVVSGDEGDGCATIYSPGVGGWGDDPPWIARLWSADIALIETAAMRISTGELAYRLRSQPALFNVTTDEGRGLFYASGGFYDSENHQAVKQINTIRGEDGVVTRSLTVERIETDTFHGWNPALAYDPLRDVLLIHRSSLEIRDPLMGTLKGEIALLDHPDSYLEARILLDPDTDHVFIVYSGAWKDGRPTPGTPVTSIRLPPP